jgi:mono/diheme cytochrome c family protein
MTERMSGCAAAWDLLETGPAVCRDSEPVQLSFAPARALFEAAEAKKGPAMNPWLRRAGIGALGLAVLAASAVFTGLQLAERRLARKVEVPARPLAYRDDAQALERGRYLFASRGCADCHGANGAGRVFVDEGSVRIKGPNITTGPGGVVAGYQPVDWVRVIRHGVAPGGRPLMIMPSEDYARWTDTDVASLVAYIRSLPPAPGTGAEIRLPLPARVLYGFGAIQDAAAKIDHSLPPQQPVAEAVTPQHGAYVANMCIGCHGAQLTGGRIPGGPPDWPPATNLTPAPGGSLARYPTADALLAMFRSGKRPDGSAIKVMPFDSLRELSEVDVRALHLYLKTLPPRT